MLSPGCSERVHGGFGASLDSFCVAPCLNPPGAISCALEDEIELATVTFACCDRVQRRRAEHVDSLVGPLPDVAASRVTLGLNVSQLPTLRHRSLGHGDWKMA